MCHRSRPPSDWIPSAVRSDSVRRPIGFRPPSVEKCWEKFCKNVVLNGNTIGYFAIFDVSVFRCFYYPHPNNLCRSVKSVGGHHQQKYCVEWNLWEDHCLLGWCTSCSGKRQIRAETSAPHKIASEICGRILSNKFYEFCVFCGRPFRQTFDEIVLFCPISQAFRTILC